MQAIKIEIPGKYYDSQIYSGNLYLWDEFGETIKRLDWYQFVDWILNKHVPRELHFVTHCALSENQTLYDTKYKYLVSDPAVQKILRARFGELQQFPIIVSSLTDIPINSAENKTSFPHADTLIYNNQLFVGSVDGLFLTSQMNRRPLEKIWDGPSLNLSARNWTVAIAAGSEGLYEAALSRKIKVEEHVAQEFPNSTNSVRWMYYSLFGSDYESGYFANYHAEYIREYDDQDQKNKRRLYRHLIERLPADQIFDSNAVDYSWGVHDKLCRLQGNQLDIKQYFQREHSITSMEGVELSISSDFGEIVSADSAPFGYVLEYDEGLLIVTSDGHQYLLPNEPINWRIFPNSKYYSNHLHVIYEDHLAIYSFYHDYFIEEQKTKNVGIRYDDFSFV